MLIVDAFGQKTVAPHPPIARQDAARFDRAISQARQERPARPEASPSDSRILRWGSQEQPPAPPPQQGVTHGPAEPEAGIERYSALLGRWPFRVFRDSAFGYQDNDELHAQLSATPALDPKPFGTRPGAPEGADRVFPFGGEIIVLDEVRLLYLEQQRSLLDAVTSRPANDAQSRGRDAAIDRVSASVASEIDYATLGRAVPDIDQVAATISARAPDDEVFQEAVRRAKSDMTAMWQAQGRTEDQIGELLEAGQDHRFGQVRTRAREQLIEVADQTADTLPSGIDPLEGQARIEAAIDARSIWYRTYVTGDPSYVEALNQGLADAKDEIFVERPIEQVIEAGEPGGLEGAQGAMAELRAVTDPENSAPQHVQAIVSDPRIGRVMRWSFSQATHRIDPDDPEPGTENILEDLQQQGALWDTDAQIMADLTEVSQNAVYSDGPTPGRGKEAVDDLAAYIARVGSSDLVGRYEVDGENIFLSDEMPFFDERMQAAAREGNIALGLAITAHADRNDDPILGPLTIDATNHGLAEFKGDVDDRMAEAQEHAAQLTVPAELWGGASSDAERLQTMAAILEDDPELADTLQQDAEDLARLTEQAQSIRFALNAYRPELAGTPGYDQDIQVHRPGSTTQTSLADQVDAFGLPEVSQANYWWYLRAQRFALDFLVREGLTHSVLNGDSPIRGVLFGNPSGGRDPAVAVRGMRMLSAWMFYENARSLTGSPDNLDRLYVWHYAMALQQGVTAMLPSHDPLVQRLFGTVTDQHGVTRTNTPNLRLYNLATAQIDALRASGTSRGLLNRLGAGGAHLLRGLATGPIDAGYILVDAYNAYGNLRRGDEVRAAAYTISALGDLAFVFAGMTSAGAGVTTVSATGAATTTFGGLSATAWTGIGAALLVIASSINYWAGRRDRANQFDAANESYLRSLDLDPELARVLSQGELANGSIRRPWEGFPFYYADNEAYGSAGPLLMTAFREAGYSTEEAIDFMNDNWSAEDAQKLRDYIQDHTNRRASDLDGPLNGYDQEDLDDAARYAREHAIDYPRA